MVSTMNYSVKKAVFSGEEVMEALREKYPEIMNLGKRAKIVSHGYSRSVEVEFHDE